MSIKIKSIDANSSFNVTKSTCTIKNKKKHLKIKLKKQLQNKTARFVLLIKRYGKQNGLSNESITFI